MDETRFDKLAAETLKKLERALTDVDSALEADLSADILTLEFEDGRQFIINSHRAARQIWMAAASRAWHFSYEEPTHRWIDTREGHELYALVKELVSKAVGRPVAMRLDG
jgi:CyaY protein